MVSGGRSTELYGSVSRRGSELNVTRGKTSLVRSWSPASYRSLTESEIAHTAAPLSSLFLNVIPSLLVLGLWSTWTIPLQTRAVIGLIEFVLG